jgi:hypothetical protein
MGEAPLYSLIQKEAISSRPRGPFLLPPPPLSFKTAKRDVEGFSFSLKRKGKGLEVLFLFLFLFPSRR